MKNRIFINFLLFFSVACFLHADAQYMLITHFSGSAAYGSYNVTVTSGGSVTTGGSSCLPAPTAYWIAPSSSIGWYTYTFSAPVSSVQVHVDGMNGGTYGAGDILKVFINGAPYVITPADITSYTGCGGPGGPCYLLGGYLYGPVGTTLVYTGADMTITYCGGINSIELYTDHSTSGMDYHIGIDTSVVGAALVGAITGPSVVCIGSTITLSDTSSGGTWASSTPSVATVSAGVVTGISAGIDTIKYTVTTLCGPVTVTKVITVNPNPPITGITHVCIGATTTLSDAMPGGTWSSVAPGIATIGATTGIVTGISGGTALISYTDVCGTVTTTVTVYPAPTPISGILTICVGSTTTLSDGLSGGTWSSGSPGTASVGSGSGVVTGIAAGIANITYTTTCGQAVAAVTVQAAPAPISGPASICIGHNGTYTDATGGGYWSSSHTGIASVGSVSGIATGISVGTTIISYTLGLSCTATKTVTIVGLPDPGTIVFTPSPYISFCTGSKTVLSDTVLGGIWSITNNHVTLSGDTLTAITPGLDTIYYTVTNACGSAVAIDSIRVIPPPPPIQGRLSICLGDTVKLYDSVFGGMWQSGSCNLYADGNFWDSGVVVGLAAGTAILSYSEDWGCTTTAIVTINALPAAGTITGFSPLCVGAIKIFRESVTGGIWGSTNSAAASIDSLSGKVKALALGNTIITYKVGPDINGCHSTATFPLTIINRTFNDSAVITDVRCNGDQNGSIMLYVIGAHQPYLYNWPNGTTTPYLLDLSPGSYSVRISDTFSQCTVIDTFKIVQPDSIHINPEVKKDYCQAHNGSIEIIATGGIPPYQYAWSNSVIGNFPTNLSAGDYEFTLTDQNGCKNQITISVPDTTCPAIIIHDGISPNGDGINDTWIIEGIQNYPKNIVKVFDKWGDEVFGIANYNNDWGGKSKNGSFVPDGTYYYLVKLNTSGATGGNDILKGALMIKR